MNSRLKIGIGIGIVLLSGLALRAPANPSEGLGVFKAGEVSALIGYQDSSHSESSSDFFIEQTELGFAWTPDPKIAFEIGFGTRDLRRPYLLFSDSDQKDELVLSKAFGHFDFSWGDIEAGLLPLHLSYETYGGRLRALEMRSVLLNEGWLPVVDYGIRYRARSGEFTTELTLSEGAESLQSGGESETSSENLWWSGLWAFENKAGFGVLASGITGRFMASADLYSNGEWGWEPEESGLFRQGTLAFYQHTTTIDLLFEISFGKWIAGEEELNFEWAKLAGRYKFLENQALTLSVERLRPNIFNSDLNRFRSSLKWSLYHPLKLTALDVSYRHHSGPEEQKDDHQLELAIRLHSSKLL